MENKPFTVNYKEGKAFWQVDILWVVLAGSAYTNGQYTMLWQLCPKGSGPPPHYHDQDEGFFVTEGEITYLAGGEQLVAKTGAFVWIPRGTVHSFRVDSETATLLNFYTPGGFEKIITEASLPAESFTLPPKGLPMKMDSAQVRKISEEIGMHWGQEPDVLRMK